MKLIVETLVLSIWMSLAAAVPMPGQNVPGTDSAKVKFGLEDVSLNSKALRSGDKLLFVKTLCLLSNKDPVLLDRCDDVVFDAVTPDESGAMFFFKAAHVWKGFRGAATSSDESFNGLGDTPVDAAFNLHSDTFFIQGEKVSCYNNHTLKEGYPKTLQEAFPGIPPFPDAAVGCPKGECKDDTVLFFKGDQVHVYDVPTKVVKSKTWSHLPLCNSAFRWMEHYYCFHGGNFTKFNPVTGEVTGNYPKEIRNYFMNCGDSSHGESHQTPKCSDVKLDAVTTDDSGKSYSFSGALYTRSDVSRETNHPFYINRQWRELNSVDAVFTHENKMYFIKGDQVYIYKGGAQYTLIQGYPKPLQEELGIYGNVDAAFLCNGESTVHLIQGNTLRDVDLNATPRVVTSEHTLPLSGIDAALCDASGIKLFKGHEYYEFENTRVMIRTPVLPEPKKINSLMMSCVD